MRLLLIATALLTGSGCLSSYKVYRTGDYVDASDAHYVIVRTRLRNAVVFDCRSSLRDGDWDPRCKRVDLRKD